MAERSIGNERAAFKVFARFFVSCYILSNSMRAVVLHLPESVSTAVVFASPHSGRVYPHEFLAEVRLSGPSLRSSEDAYVDLLLATAPRFGAPLLTTEVPRAYVDFNRAASELDPLLIPEAPRRFQNPRIASGLGVIPRVVAGGRALYSGPLPQGEAERRIARYWRPYHAALRRLVDEQRARFGRALLIDVHSMPHEAVRSAFAQASGQSRTGYPRSHDLPEIILGDRYGKSCRPETLAAVEAVFRREGLRVAKNAPFAGAYTAEAYGQPSAGVEVVQVEIDRALYLDEAWVEPSPNFAAFSAVMKRIVAALAALGRAENANAPALAAE